MHGEITTKGLCYTRSNRADEYWSAYSKCTIGRVCRNTVLIGEEDMYLIVIFAIWPATLYVLLIRTIISYTRGQTPLASGSRVTYRISSPNMIWLRSPPLLNRIGGIMRSTVRPCTSSSTGPQPALAPALAQPANPALAPSQFLYPAQHPSLHLIHRYLG